MSAIRLARFTRRDRIVKFAGCYHGHVDALLVSAGSGLATLGIPARPGAPTAAAADTIVLPFNDLEAAAAAVERYGEGLAAIVVEPVAGNMGVVPPEPGFLERCATLRCERRAMLVFDEVITGFRVARGGAQERFGVLPDLTILGKIVGGGLPLAAFGGRADVMDRLAPAGDVYQAGTLSGNPLATAGVSVLRRLRDDAVYERLEASARGLRPASPASAPCSASARWPRLRPRRPGAQLRGRRARRHGALRRALPRPARARDLYRALAVRVPVRLHRALGGRHRPHDPGRWRHPRRLISGTSRRGAAAESLLWADALRPAGEREHDPVFSTLAVARHALGVETIYEGYLVHQAAARGCSRPPTAIRRSCSATTSTPTASFASPRAGTWRPSPTSRS